MGGGDFDARTALGREGAGCDERGDARREEREPELVQQCCPCSPAIRKDTIASAVVHLPPLPLSQVLLLIWRSQRVQ